MDVVYLTRGLAEWLLEMSAEEEPEQFAVALEVTSAGEFEADLGLAEEVPVFTHFYHPDAGRSVTAVFGMDFSTPMGMTKGRFVSHPRGNLSVTLRDDLHAVVLVAIPPWELASLAAFDRAGRKKTIELVDAEPPEEALP